MADPDSILNMAGMSIQLAAVVCTGIGLDQAEKVRTAARTVNNRWVEIATSSKSVTPIAGLLVLSIFALGLVSLLADPPRLDSSLFLDLSELHHPPDLQDSLDLALVCSGSVTVILLAMLAINPPGTWPRRMAVVGILSLWIHLLAIFLEASPSRLEWITIIAAVIATAAALAIMSSPLLKKWSDSDVQGFFQAVAALFGLGVIIQIAAAAAW